MVKAFDETKPPRSVRVCVCVCVFEREKKSYLIPNWLDNGICAVLRLSIFILINSGVTPEGVP